MEFQDVVVRRRMIRRYQPGRRVPSETVDRIMRNAVRAPSAGFTQGWGFLVLETAEDIARFREVVTPVEDSGNWFAAEVDAPLIVIPMSNKDAYLDRYALPDKGMTDLSDEWWPAPYWDIDTGFAALLMLLTAVDEGLGACFFAIPLSRIEGLREVFGIPKEYKPIGAISIGYRAESGETLRDLRRPIDQTVRRGSWNINRQLFLG